jgi:hypothetical protein
MIVEVGPEIHQLLFQIGARPEQRAIQTLPPYRSDQPLVLSLPRHKPVRDSAKRSITGYRLNHTPMGQRQPQRNRRRRRESPHAFPMRKGIRPPRIREP